MKFIIMTREMTKEILFQKFVFIIQKSYPNINKTLNYAKIYTIKKEL